MPPEEERRQNVGREEFNLLIKQINGDLRDIKDAQHRHEDNLSAVEKALNDGLVSVREALGLLHVELACCVTQDTYNEDMRQLRTRPSRGYLILISILCSGVATMFTLLITHVLR